MTAVAHSTREVETTQNRRPARADRAAGSGAVRVRVTHPAPHQARFIFTAPGVVSQPIVLHDAGEIAVALHYSGQPLSRALTDDEVLALVVRGAVAVGVEHIRAATLGVRADNLAFQNKAISPREWRRLRDGFWSASREQLCTDLAWCVLYATRPAGGAR